MNKIKSFRIEMGITQYQLADLMGVSTKTISRWEAGSREPELSEVARLAGIFNCSMDSLIPNPPLPPRRKRKTATLGAKTETVL